MSLRLEIFLVLVCLILTASLFASSTRNHAAIAEDEFRILADDSVQVLRTRMLTYLQSIKGTAAFVAASDKVTADDFATYINNIDIAKLLPGIRGIGLIEAVPDAGLKNFAERVRTEGQPNFSLRRVSDADTHYIIKFIEPAESNAQALGLDITFADEPTQALLAALDSGLPKMTPPRQLVQDGQSAVGLVLYLPVFSSGSLSEQADPFSGWVQAAFNVDSLIAGLTSGLDESYQMQIVDGTSFQNGVPVFDGLNDSANESNHFLIYHLNLFGRTWNLGFYSTPKFDQAFHSYQPLTILIAGLSLSGLIVLVLRILRIRSESLAEIAELRRRQIQSREEENRSILENAVTSVMLVDSTDRILFANQAAQNCFGYPEEELKSMRFSSLVKELETAQETHNAVACTKEGLHLELDLQRNDWLTSDGVSRTTAIIRDVTTENTAQRELSKNKSLYDMALQGSEIGVFDVNLNTGTSEVSETWCRIMGYGSGCNNMDTQGDFLSRIHPEDMEILQKADTDCIEGKTKRSIAEYRLQSSDQSWRWMRSDAVVAEWDQDGKATRLIGTQSDVTKLRHNRNALEASEKRFRQVLANAPIGMALMDDAGKFIGVNDAFCQLVGVDADALMQGGRLGDMIEHADRKNIYTEVTKLMKEKEKSVYTSEHEIAHTDGSKRWGLLNVSWSFDKNKGSNFFIAQIIDITDQKILSAAKDEFVSTVSHELRTPLTSIKGALALLTASNDATFSKPQTRLVDIAKSNADRLTEIVNDILDLEKISSGAVNFDLADINLNDVITEVVTEMSPFAVTHASTMRIDGSCNTLNVHADPGRTKQVLANLISNACKYSSPDSEVMIKSEMIGDMAIVYVQNVGPGVPESFKKRIFEAFSQADSSDTRAKGGTGLGLNISRQIVLRHGGQIGFESARDGVTVFWFTVPLAANAQCAASPVVPLCDNAVRTLSVLHVEDDHDFAEVVSGALAGTAQVSHAKSILMAKRALVREKFDVVMLDWSLPDGDGRALLENIVKEQPQARIIALSADNERAPDSRLAANMIKSRTEISTIVATVNGYQPLAS